MTLDLREGNDVLLVGVRVKPRTRSGVTLTDQGLVLGVAAAPVAGKATEEAAEALAEALGVPPSAVRLHGGARSRSKVFAVSGMDVQTARARLRSVARQGLRGEAG